MRYFHVATTELQIKRRPSEKVLLDLHERIAAAFADAGIPACTETRLETEPDFIDWAAAGLPEPEAA